MPPTGANPPFTVVNRRADAKANGEFTSIAEASFDVGLLSSGLLAALSGTNAKTLIAVLSTVTANGRVCAPPHLVARTLGVPVVVARARLLALSMRSWRGRRIVFGIGDGANAGYSVSPEIVGQRLGPLEYVDTEPRTIAVAGRDVFQHAREKYSRPRAEVERELASVHGWVLPEEYAVAAGMAREPEPALGTDGRHVRERLMRHGVDRHATDDLVRRCGRDRVARQIAYLPYRRAKAPTRALVSAIAADWEPPQGCPADLSQWLGMNEGRSRLPSDTSPF